MAPPAPPPTRDRPGRHRTDTTLGLREAADRLGVHYMTAYRYVRSGRLPATKVGDEWRVAEADLAVLRPGPASTGRTAAGPARSAGPAGSAPRHRPVRMCARLIAGDEAGAWGLVESALAAGVAPQEVLTADLVPALREIGERWAAGDLSIAEEHRASTVATRLVARLGPALGGPGRRRGTIVVGSVAGDHHALPTAILGDLLRGARFEVVDLGADTPAESFVEAAAGADRLVAVALSVTAPDALAVAPGTVDAVRAALPEVPVLVGGGAVTDASVAAALGSDAWAAGPADVVALFESLARERFG